MAIRTFHDFDVYRESYSAALEVSALTKTFPYFERLELGRQLRRSARSIPANIVEGWGKRFSTLEFKRYLQNAIGSCLETRMWLEMSNDEGYTPREKFEELNKRYEKTGAMLAGLWKNWRNFDKD